MYSLEVGLSSNWSGSVLYIVEMRVEDLLSEGELLTWREFVSDGVESSEEVRVGRSNGGLYKK